MMSLWIAQASTVVAPASTDTGEGWLIDPELVGPGYSQTMAGDTIQTQFPPPQPPPEMPGWLNDAMRAIGRFFEWTAPLAQPLLWIGLGLLVLLLLYLLVPAFAQWVDDLMPWRRRPEEPDEIVGQAEAVAARALLAEADALAAAGRFAEAAHLLLYRSVEDIEARRPGLVRPAMTSRELAAADGLPAVAREAFSRIARAVEISLFGGRAIDAGAWQQCRTAYADMTIAKNWGRA